MPIEQIMLGAAVLLLASVLAGKLSARLGVPALLLFLAVGMLAGSDGPGGLPFDHPQIAESVGVVALTFILFGGGLDTHWPSVRPVLRASLILSTVGVAVTATLVGLCAKFVFGWTLREGILLGAIVSATDAAAVFGILRSKSLGLPASLKSLLEFESGSNDPMAVFLTLGMIAFLGSPAFGPIQFALMFVQQMAIGGALGYGMGKLMAFAVNRLNLEFEGLYPVVTISLVLLTYGLSAVVGGNGFLAVYLAAIIFGNSEFPHKRSLVQFHDGLGWLMQIALFLTLGLQVFPSRLPAVAVEGVVISLFLMFVARPIPVLGLLTGSPLSWRERVLVAWAGLRGGAPIVLATFPLIAGTSKADLIFDVVFFVVLLSSLIQGTSIGWLSVRLGLAPASEVFASQEAVTAMPVRDHA